MERSTQELLEKQLEFEEALKVHKLQKQALIGKEIELIEKRIEIIKSRIKGKIHLKKLKFQSTKIGMLFSTDHFQEFMVTGSRQQHIAKRSQESLTKHSPPEKKQKKL
jgi:hypothetical protein